MWGKLRGRDYICLYFFVLYTSEIFKQKCPKIESIKKAEINKRKEGKKKRGKRWRKGRREEKREGRWERKENKAKKWGRNVITLSMALFWCCYCMSVLPHATVFYCLVPSWFWWFPPMILSLQILCIISCIFNTAPDFRFFSYTRLLTKTSNWLLLGSFFQRFWLDHPKLFRAKSFFVILFFHDSVAMKTNLQ